MISFRTLFRDVVAYGIMGGISRSVHLLLLPILTRRFSTDEYGTVDVVATLTSVLTLAMALSLESAVARSWFDAGHTAGRKPLVSSILFFTGAVGLAVVGVIWLAAEPLAGLLLEDPGKGVYIVIGALGALVTALSHLPQIVLRMQRRIAFYTAVTLIQTVSFALLALLLAFTFRMGVLGVVVAQVLASGLALAVGLAAIAPYLEAGWSWVSLKGSLQFSLPLVPAVVVSKLNKYLDRMLILAFLGLGAVGVFGAAARVASIVSLLVDVSRQAWLPLAMSQIDNEHGRSEFYRRALNYYAGSMAAVALVIAAYSRELMGWLVPVEYLAGYSVIPWLAGAHILHGSAQFTNIGTLITRRTFRNSTAAWTGAAVNIALGLLLIPRLGMWGAAVGVFVGSLLFTSLLYRTSQETTETTFDLSRLVGILGCYVTACMAFVAIYEFLSGPVPSFAARTLVLGISLGAISYLSMDAPAFRALRSAIKLEGLARPS